MHRMSMKLVLHLARSLSNTLWKKIWNVRQGFFKINFFQKNPEKMKKWPIFQTLEPLEALLCQIRPWNPFHQVRWSLSYILKKKNFKFDHFENLPLSVAEIEKRQNFSKNENFFASNSLKIGTYSKSHPLNLMVIIFFSNSTSLTS